MAKTIQCVQVSFTTTSGVIPVGFDGGDGVTGFVLHTSADCYVDFDRPVEATQSFKIVAANNSDTLVDHFGGTVKNLYVQGVSGSGTLYIIATTK